MAAGLTTDFSNSLSSSSSSPALLTRSVSVMLYNGVSNRSRGWKSKKPGELNGAGEGRLSRQPSLLKFDGAARSCSGWDYLRKVMFTPTQQTSQKSSDLLLLCKMKERKKERKGKQRTNNVADTIHRTQSFGCGMATASCTSTRKDSRSGDRRSKFLLLACSRRSASR